MPDTSEDIPPPPASSPPSPPYNNSNNPPTPNRAYGTIRPGFAQSPASNSMAPERGEAGVGTVWREQGTYYRDSPEHQFQAEEFNHSGPTAQQSLHMRRAQVPENPYSDLAKLNHSSMFAPNKPMRRKGMLVKQPNVEDSPEKTTISIPTIIIKEPSTSSSGKSSQGSSMEIETSSQDHPGQLRPDDGPSLSNPFAPHFVQKREKRLEVHRNSPSFRSTDLCDDDSPTPTPAPRLRHSKSIDEGMFSSDERLRRLMAPPTSLLNFPRGGGSGGGNVTDFNSPEPTMVREVLSTRTGHHSPISLPANKTYNVGGGNYVHPVTGKPLDPNSPLALALAARDRAMREQSQPLPLKSDLSKPDLNKPLFIDTKLRMSELSFSATATMGRPGRSALRRQMTEAKYETESKYSIQDGLHLRSKEEKRPEEKKNMLIDIVDTSQQKSAGLLMVHTTTDGSKNSLSEGEREEAVSSDSAPGELRDPNQPAVSANPVMPKPLLANHGKTIITISSVDEPVKLPFAIPPPPMVSVDIDEEFPFSDPLPPPLEFANSFDIPEEQAGALAELLRQKANGTSGSSLTPFYAQLSAGNAQIKRPAVLTNCTPPSFPPMDTYEPITDSGIEVDSRSSGDPQLETTSTVSTVSSISTLSSEGGETLDTCMVYADGQAFLADRPQGISKPKVKSNINKNALYKEEENISPFRVPGSIPPPPPNTAPPEPPKTPTQRTSKLWGDPTDLKSPHASEPKLYHGMGELNSALQHLNKDKMPKPGEGFDSPTGSRTHLESRYIFTLCITGLRVGSWI